MQKDRAQVKLLPLPYPEMDSGDVVVADSSDGLLSSLLVGGGWDMPDAGAGGKGVDSGAAVGEASGGAGVTWPTLACDSKEEGVRRQHSYQVSTPCPTQPHPASG